MGEYARIGEGWVFWRKYGTHLHAVDASLVRPALDSLGASTVGTKWLEDSNFFRCRMDGREFQILLDLPDDESGIVEVNVLRVNDHEKTVLGTVCVQVPCEDYTTSREQLQALLQTCLSTKAE